ncbi:hypothetical protein AC1031_004449 [Aphanomyces cochlioides]|nr:hypothetical protein AC1031_004449 [Aphanomyces cochlioides]
MVYWIAFVLAVLSTGATSSTHLDIVGGVVVEEATPAYIATLRAEEFQTTICTGILIAPRYILTTAKCTKLSPRWASINSRFRQGRDGEHIRITGISQHPKFKWPEFTYDMAVLLLERASINTPATLTFDSYEATTQVVMQGFGQLGYKADFADVLREAKGTIAVNADCNRVGSPLAGDKGGPLTLLNKEGHEAVVALHSWNALHCDVQYGGFTRLGPSQDFLKSFLQGQGVCKRPVERPSLH